MIFDACIHAATGALRGGSGFTCCVAILTFKIHACQSAKSSTDSVSIFFDCSKGLRPLPPTPADFRIFGFCDFPNMSILDFFAMASGFSGGLQAMGNGAGLQID